MQLASSLVRVLMCIVKLLLSALLLGAAVLPTFSFSLSKLCKARWLCGQLFALHKIMHNRITLPKGALDLTIVISVFLDRDVRVKSSSSKSPTRSRVMSDNSFQLSMDFAITSRSVKGIVVSFNSFHWFEINDLHILWVNILIPWILIIVQLHSRYVLGVMV